MIPDAPRGTAGDGPSQGLVVITARIHSPQVEQFLHAIPSKLLELLC
jgi:hypothetical protein